MFPSGIQQFDRNFSMLPTVHCPCLFVGLFFSLSPIFFKNCHLLSSASPVFLLSLLFHILCNPLSLSTCLNICMSLQLLLLLSGLFHAPCPPSVSLYLPYLCVALTLLLLWFCSLPRHVSHTLHLPCFPQEILCRYTTTSMVTWLASLCALVAWRAGRLLNACMPAVRGLITVTSTVWAKG